MSSDFRKNKLKKEVFPTRNLPSPQDIIHPYHSTPAAHVYPQQFVTDMDADDITLDELPTYSHQEEIQRSCAIRLNETESEVNNCGCDWQQKYARQQKAQATRVLTLQRKIKRLSANISSIKKKYIVPSLKASKESIAFAELIVSEKNDYTDEDRNVAQNIEYISPKAYLFMRNTLGFKLPSTTTLWNYRPIKCFKSGKDIDVIENLRAMTTNMDAQQRECVLLLDEVTIDKRMVYNKSNDRIDGLVDFYHGERKQEVATKALVFMVKGVFSAWKYVISYYATSSKLRHDVLKEIILENVDVLQNVGLTVTSIIMDQESANIGAVNRLDVSIETPYYISSNGDKIYVMYDYCYLIKAIRNTLLHNDINTSHGTASAKVLRAVFDSDTESLNIKMTHKLKYGHLYPSNQQKMCVSKAVQLLSHSVDAAIGTLNELDYFNDELKPMVAGTQHFVRMFNRIFDMLNSKNIHDKNPDRTPMNRGEIERVQFILEFIDYMESFRFVGQNLNKCIEGFILTLRGLLEMRQHLFIKYPVIQYVLFGKFTQDALENLFFKIRSKGGANPHPTINQLQYTLARLISMKIISYKYNLANKNCEDNADVMLEWAQSEQESQEDQQPILRNILNTKIDIDDNDNELDQDEDYVPGVSQLEAQALPYYTGYTVFSKFVKNLKCERCLKMATAPSNAPSASTSKALNNNISKYFFSIYKTIFTEHFHVINLRKTIIDEIKRTMATTKYNLFFDESDPCYKHREDLLEFYLTALLYKNCKNINDEAEAERATAGNMKASERVFYARLTKKYNMNN